MAVATYRSFEDPTTGQTWLKAAMFAAAIAFVVGRLAVIV
jgi:geranylgeranylglycerol-phosphate geranylgeranyltransferase